MKQIILFLSLTICLCWGCYDDKGNYDYKEINEFHVSITPEGKDGEYTYRQPINDTLKITYTATVRQTLQKNNDNMNCMWQVFHGKETDTIYGWELTLKYAPQVETKYTVLLRVTDETDHIAWHQQLKMHTQFPFMKSWFILHGMPGDRKLGVIESPNDPDNVTISTHTYEDIYGDNRFKNAERLIYVDKDGGFDPSTWEQLTITSPDSLYFMMAYDLKVKNTYANMMPTDGVQHQIIDGTSVKPGNLSILKDSDDKLYHAGGYGIYYNMKVNNDVADYAADKVYIATNGYATIWDETNRQLMYYFLNGNYYLSPRNEAFNASRLTAFPVAVYNKTAWTGKKVLWMGYNVNPTDSEKRGASILTKDETGYSLHHITYREENATVKMTEEQIENIDTDEQSCFASTNAFANQLFYSVGSAIYLLNTVSGDIRLLYDAGGTITKLEFATTVSIDRLLTEGEERMLGVVVQKGNAGELHHLFLDEAADMQNSTVYTGFEPIEDICFSLVSWNMFGIDIK